MEKSFIAWVQLQSKKLAQVSLGIGDDAAVLSPSTYPSVVTCDSLCEGTHFILDECGARVVGRKLASVNISDIAAMGAVPVAIFLSYCLPRDRATELAQDLTLGVMDVAAAFDVAIAGGDTNVWSGPLVVHATVIGLASQGEVWRRDQAKVGDLVAVSGHLGGSILGRHLEFIPRVELAKKLREYVTVHSACDTSDGLATDLLNICSASRCGAELFLEKIPTSKAALELSAKDGKSAVDHALSDGEDFELLFTISKADAGKLPAEVDGVPITIVGEIVSRTGLWHRSGGKLLPLKASGYQHK